MKFTYTYRSSDGQRHAAEIEAESRDAAFARLRTEFGIKPIKVELKIGDGKIEGRRNGFKGLKGTIVLVFVAALLVAVAVWLWNVARPEAVTYQGRITYTQATSLTRQEIPGDRRHIEEAIRLFPQAANGAVGRNPPTQVGNGCVFRFAAEVYLARFAEPGRPVVDEGSPPLPSEEDFKACLDEPIMIASNDFTEIVDLKRIVTGMKRELRAYLAGGGTVSGYAEELVKRQAMEAGMREKAAKRLEELMSNQKEAYAFWLRANARLESMGIYPLPLTPALRTYQQMHPFDEGIQ